MRQLLFFLVFTISATAAFSHGIPVATLSADTVISDTVGVRKQKKVDISIGKDDSDSVRTRSDGRKSRAPGVLYGLTLSRIDLGFSKLIDNGSFTLSEENDFLDYNGWKTINVGFDLLQFGYRFNSYFKIYLSGGIDWTHIRLDRDITILRDAPVLSYEESTIDFDKNRFSSTYLRLPLSFEFRTKDDNKGKKFRFVAGPDMGFLINGRVKQKSDENGKQKFNDNYHFTRFRYGAFARIGYGGAGLYAKYYFNDMFENSPAQKGLNNMAFGVCFGF